jgi:CRP-like cAMP-binding protein
LSGHYYLVAGRLKDRISNAVVRPSSAPIFSSSECTSRCSASAQRELVTATAAHLLHVDIRPIAFLLEAEGDQIPSERAEEDAWQIRFLRSHMLAPLSFPHWQKILSALQPRDVQAGDWVFRTGEQGDHCFIMAHGHGRVMLEGAILRELGPGDFFGEDALLSGAGRNACVQMSTVGRLMSLEAPLFHRWLADLLVAGEGLEDLHSNQPQKTLRVYSSADLRSRLQALDPCTCYRIEGESRLSRLAVFLLRQRGVRAQLAQADTVRSFAQERSAAIDSPRMTDIG